MKFISYAIASIILIPAVVFILIGSVFLGLSERIDEQPSIDIDYLIGQ